jgi:hypothetical protein
MNGRGYLPVNVVILSRSGADSVLFGHVLPPAGEVVLSWMPRVSVAAGWSYGLDAAPTCWIVRVEVGLVTVAPDSADKLASFRCRYGTVNRPIQSGIMVKFTVIHQREPCARLQ